jgi:hypothetical protein
VRADRWNRERDERRAIQRQAAEDHKIATDANYRAWRRYKCIERNVRMGSDLEVLRRELSQSQDRVLASGGKRIGIVLGFNDGEFDHMVLRAKWITTHPNQWIPVDLYPLSPGATQSPQSHI